MKDIDIAASATLTSGWEAHFHYQRWAVESWPWKTDTLSTVIPNKIFSRRSKKDGKLIFTTVVERSILTIKYIHFLYLLHAVESERHYLSTACSRIRTALILTRPSNERYRSSGQCYAEVRLVPIDQARMIAKSICSTKGERFEIGHQRSELCLLSYPKGYVDTFPPVKWKIHTYV